MVAFLLSIVFSLYALPNSKHSQLAHASSHAFLLGVSIAGGLVKVSGSFSLQAGGGELELIPGIILAQLGVLTLSAALLFFSLQMLPTGGLALSIVCNAAALGGSIIAQSQSLPLALLILELQSYALYAMLTLTPEGDSISQGCLTYFLVSSLATACIILGWGFLTFTSGVFYPSSLGVGGSALAVIIVGFILKLGAFPFQGWVPLVYKELPLPSLLGAAVLPQLATMLLLIGLIAPKISQTLLLAGLTILAGSLGAAFVTKTNSLLALSGVSSLGVALTALGLSPHSLLAFSATYSLTLVAIGTSLTLITPIYSSLSMLRGASGTMTPVAVSLILFLISLGGVPPSLGFFTKANLILEGSGQGISLTIILCLMGGLPGMVSYLRLALTIITPDWNTYRSKKISPIPSIPKETLSYTLTLILGAFALGYAPQIF